jgi:hypothetical protein
MDGSVPMVELGGVGWEGVGVWPPGMRGGRMVWGATRAMLSWGAQIKTYYRREIPKIEAF